MRNDSSSNGRLSLSFAYYNNKEIVSLSIVFLNFPSEIIQYNFTRDSSKTILRKTIILSVTTVAARSP